METLIRRRAVWRMIWGCAVCICSTKRTLGLYGFRARPLDFYGGGEGGTNTLVLDFFFFTHRSRTFYFLRGTVLDFFPARIMRIETNKKVYYISIDSDLEKESRLIQNLVL